MKYCLVIVESIPDNAIQMLYDSQLFDIQCFPKPLSEKHFLSLANSVEGLIVRGKSRVTRNFLEKATRLKVVVRAGKGLDNIDVLACRDLGIVVLNAEHSNVVATAEHTLALILSLSRKIFYFNDMVRRGEWDRTPQVAELAGKVLGLWGFGFIGQAVAERALAFDLNVVVFDPHASIAPELRRRVRLLDSVEHLLWIADVVSLHVPLTKKNRGIMGEKEFRLMKPSALFVNTSRGGVVDIDALIHALTKQWISGVALDVLESEPPDPNMLKKLQGNVILTPHVAGKTVEAEIKLGKEITIKLVDFFKHLG